MSKSARTHRARRAIKLLLEKLEDRTLPSTLHVTNLLDDGSVGSLRQTIQAANSGDTIDFPGLTGTITLNGTELLLNKNVTITGLGANLLTIDGGSMSRVFEVPPSAMVTLSGITVAHGNDMTGGGGGLRNEGNVTIQACAFISNISVGGSPISGGGGGG